MPSELDRPRILTPDAQAKIVLLLKEGNFLSTACRAAGTTRQTFHYWKSLYESGAEHAKVYADFFDACAEAMAIAEAAALRVVREGAMGWQGPAWFLERRYPGRWGKKDTVTLKGVPKDLSSLTDEELDELHRRVGGKGRR